MVVIHYCFILTHICGIREDLLSQVWYHNSEFARLLITFEQVSSIALILGIVTGGHDLLAGNNKNYIEWYNMAELNNGSLFLISDQS